MEASCRQAPTCGISLQPPYHTAGTDVDACIRFYDDACLHGLDVSDPGPASVQACVNAIQTKCTVVAKPETDPACAWLIPPAPAAAASDAGDSSVAPSDAGDSSAD
jgi:hypothetical protein